MKLFIITDIHGSKKYLELALEKYKKDNYNKLIILGDILYHGPRNDLPEGYEPKEVIKLLNNLKEQIIAIKGNCDAKIDEDVLDFPLFPEVLLNIGNKNVLFTHGDMLDEVDYDGYIIYGHFHKNNFDDNMLSIGSLSIPKDGHHSYAVLSDNVLSSYDLLDDALLMRKELC